MPEFQPLDYSSAFSNVPQPGQSFLQGVQGGLATQDALLQQAVKRYQFGRQQQMQSMAANVAANPTPENIAQLSIAFPEMSENFKRSYDMLQPQQQRADLQHMTGVYAAMQSGRPDVAAQLLRDRATALENSGASPSLIQAAKAMAEWATTHPETFKTSAGVMLASVMGPEKFGQTFKDIGEGQTTQDKRPAAVQEAQATADIKTTEAAAAPQKIATDIDNVRSQINTRAGQLALDRDKLMSETQLKLRELNLQYGTPPDDTRKLINDSAIGAATGEQSAAKLNDLAGRLEDFDKRSGGTAKIDEAWKQATGSEDGVTAMRQEYARIVNNQALSTIKESLGGRVTDVDMKVAMGTVPSPTASVQTQVAYLRGTAKLQQLEAARQQAQAEWLSQVGRAGHLGPTKTDITVMGTQVPAGTTFADFSRQFMQKKADQIAAQSSIASAQGRSYLRFAQPVAGQPSKPEGTF